MLYTPVLNRDGPGVRSPADLLELTGSAGFVDQMAGGYCFVGLVGGGPIHTFERTRKPSLDESQIRWSSGPTRDGS